MEDLPTEARSALPKLQSLDFVSQGRNVILYGNPGTGKTHIATALGILACQKGYSVLFTSVPRLLTNIREARSEQKLSRLQNKFEKYDLVICDEFGYVSCDKEGAELLFNHLSLRSGSHSTIITTNLAFSRWNEIIHDKVLVNALVDRLTHKAFIINMTGNSYRLKETQQLMTK
jgi:DNA replication protein DnaC